MGAAPLIFIDDATPREALGASPCVLVIGNFDGVHRGHRAVLEEATAEARARGMPACALTFDPHPSHVVGGERPAILTTLAHRAELVGALGVSRMFVRRFDASFAGWSPERFVHDLVAGSLMARHVVVGANFRFGAKRAGDLALLRTLGATLGFEARAHAVAADARGPFSSTRAREAITAGDLAEATYVLARPHSVSGVVVHGDARGRALGFPTANLDAVAELLPPYGIYAVTVERCEREAFVPFRQGVTSIGVRPTIVDANAGRLTVETFVFDFTGDLYGAELRLGFVARLRGEEKFATIEELKVAITNDVTEARRTLAARG